MRATQTSTPLRPLAVGVAAAALAASSLLVSAAQLSSPKVSGYGVDQHPDQAMASR
jgi:hypothetical protein